MGNDTSVATSLNFSSVERRDTHIELSLSGSQFSDHRKKGVFLHSVKVNVDQPGTIFPAIYV